jgi:hypothetical protein
MMKRMPCIAALAALLTMMLASAAGAGSDPTPEEARLQARLDPDAAHAVIELIRSARAAGLPTQPLVGRAFEGASRGAPSAVIIGAVREQLDATTTARAALGAASDPNELVAGAMALLSGVPADTLVRLRLMRPRQSLVVPLVVLSDLIARHVPVDAASSTVITASRSGARDADLLRLREHVEKALDKGASPALATGTGLRVLLRDAGREQALPDPAPHAPRRGRP